MTNAAWRDVADSDPSLVGADRSDPAVQARGRDLYKRQLQLDLKQRGITPSADNINKAWVVGAGGLEKIFQNPDASLVDTLGQNVVDINPNLQNKTGQHFIDDVDPYSRRAAAVAEAAASIPRGGWVAPEVVAAPKPEAQFGPEVRAANFKRFREALTPDPIATKGRVNPDVALRKAGLQSIYKEGNADLSVGDFNNLKEMGGNEIVANGPPVKVNSKPLERVDITRPKVTEVNTAAVLDTDEARNARISETLAEPNIKNRLQQIQQEDAKQFPTQENTPERKSFLENAISDVFGDTGLFDKKDLIRFSVVAAGGLLTGGSVGGSFRYAGLDTLKHSDVRRAQELALNKASETAKLQMQKEMRTDLRRLDSDTIKALDKKDPQVQAHAIEWMNQARMDELQGRYESSRDLYRRAHMLLTASPDVTNAKGAEDSLKGQTPGFHRGRPVVRAYSKDGTKALISENGTWKEIDPADFESNSDFRQNMDDITKSTQQQLEAKLRVVLGKGNAAEADVQSKALAHQFASLKHELGRHVTPAQFGQMAEITIAGLEPHQLAEGAISGEALRKSFFLNSVMAMRPNDTDLFRTKAGKINAPAHAEFVDELNKKIAANKASKGDPSYGVQQASDEIISEWNKLPGSAKERWDESANGKTGMTGFLRWIEDKRSKKP